MPDNIDPAFDLTRPYKASVSTRTFTAAVERREGAFAWTVTRRHSGVYLSGGSHKDHGLACMMAVNALIAELDRRAQVCTQNTRDASSAAKAASELFLLMLERKVRGYSEHLGGAMRVPDAADHHMARIPGLNEAEQNAAKKEAQAEAHYREAKEKSSAAVREMLEFADYYIPRRGSAAFCVETSS